MQDASQRRCSPKFWLPVVAFALTSAFLGYAVYGLAHLAYQCVGLLVILAAVCVLFLVAWFVFARWLAQNNNVVTDDRSVSAGGTEYRLVASAGYSGPVSAAAEPPSWGRRCCKVSGVVGFVSLLLLVVFLFSAVLFFEINTLPRRRGTINLPGLLAPVTVSREDPLGLIHIEAANEHDLFFAQGVVNAQERLWQMEFQRRVGKGTLSEVVGKGGLDIDQLSRTLGVYRASQSAYTLMKPEIKAVIDAYCEGVNAYLDTNPPRPIEFYLLGFKPDHWTGADVIVWSKLMSLTLSLNLQSELWRWDLLVKLNVTAERIEQLKPPYDISRFPIISDPNDDEDGTDIMELLRKEREALESDPQPEEPILAWLREHQHEINSDNTPGTRRMRDFGSAIRNVFGGSRASNNWVVGPNRTATGKPLLCNDPHLQLLAPSLWLVMHLKSPTLEAIGATLAGVPGVVLGRNQYIAWGVTNVGADVQDLFIMEEKPSNPLQYMYNGQWTNYTLYDQMIPVKGRDPYPLRVKQSVFGPVISNLDMKHGNISDTPLSFKWTSLEDEDNTLEAFLGVNRATNWSDFRNALRFFKAPSQNFIFADGEGNFGWQVPGRIPIRKKGHTGKYPVPGNGTYDWTAFIPFDELPRMYNPSKGYVATANNRGTMPGYKYQIALDWDAGSAGYRAQRITDMILQRPEGLAKTTAFAAEDDGLNSAVPLGAGVHTAATMVAIQQDYLSLLARDFRSVLELLPASALNAAGSDWRARLLAWNGVTAVGSMEATVFERWYTELTTLPHKEVNQSHYDNPVYLLNVFNTTQQTPLPDPACASVQLPGQPVSCLVWAADALNRVAGGNTDLQWGSEVHRARFVHPILGATPVACIACRSTNHGGDDSTVNVGGYDPDSLEQNHGPSYRHVVDLSAMEQSLFLNPLGQSGNILSKKYDNLLDLWSDASGSYMNMRMVDFPSDEVLTLSPA